MTVVTVCFFDSVQTALTALKGFLVQRLALCSFNDDDDDATEFWTKLRVELSPGFSLILASMPIVTHRLQL